MMITEHIWNLCSCKLQSQVCLKYLLTAYLIDFRKTDIWSSKLIWDTEIFKERNKLSLKVDKYWNMITLTKFYCNWNLYIWWYSFPIIETYIYGVNLDIPSEVHVLLDWSCPSVCSAFLLVSVLRQKFWLISLLWLTPPLPLKHRGGGAVGYRAFALQAEGWVFESQLRQT